MNKNRVWCPDDATKLNVYFLIWCLIKSRDLYLVTRFGFCILHFKKIYQLMWSFDASHLTIGEVKLKVVIKKLFFHYSLFYTIEIDQHIFRGFVPFRRNVPILWMYSFVHCSKWTWIIFLIEFSLVLSFNRQCKHKKNYRITNIYRRLPY